MSGGPTVEGFLHGGHTAGQGGRLQTVAHVEVSAIPRDQVQHLHEDIKAGHVRVRDGLQDDQDHGKHRCLLVDILQVTSEYFILLPTGSEERGVLWVGSIPLAILFS